MEDSSSMVDTDSNSNMEVNSSTEAATVKVANKTILPNGLPTTQLRRLKVLAVRQPLLRHPPLQHQLPLRHPRLQPVVTDSKPPTLTTSNSFATLTTTEKRLPESITEPGLRR